MDLKVIKAKLVQGTKASESSCPLCREALSAEVRGHCPSCKTPYHKACFAEFGGCATLGCSAYQRPMKGAVPQTPQACAACWEETDDLGACPECSAPIHSYCLEEEGCGTPGCARERPAPPKTRRSSEVPQNIERAAVVVLLPALLLTILIASLVIAIEVFGVYLGFLGAFVFLLVGLQVISALQT